jgi:hypothetical protein
MHESGMSAGTRRSMRRRRIRLVVVLAVLVGVIAVAGGLVAFEPWRLLTRSTVNEAIPGAADGTPDVAAKAPDASAEESPTPDASAEESPTPDASPAESPTAGAEQARTASPRPTPTHSVVASGRFVAQEHPTRGSVRILRLSGGERYVRLEGFSTSDGPDLHVWITDQAAGGSWGKYDDGRYVRLGELKGTDGNQNYRVPASADLAGMRSVVIWCDRFNVAFGSAPI